MNRPHPSAAARPDERAGYAYGLAAYGLWGVLPIYFKQLHGVSAIDIVAHRVIWSLAVLGALVAVSRSWGAIRTALSCARTRGLLLLSSVLIATNWLLYVYAINAGHILAGSLGYYLNPLANILLGRFLLKEHLDRRQWLAVAIAGAGIAVLAAGALGTLWISLTLCFSFATYGLIRKTISVESLPGLAIETMVLFPLALGWLGWHAATGADVLGTAPTTAALLIAAGLVSTVPLLCFTAAARRLPYSTVGMLQFLAPTIQFLLAVFLYGELFGPTQAIAFGCIWIALLLYVSSILAQRRQMLAE